MFIFLDTETTGTDEDDRLCQIAFKTKKRNVVELVCWYGIPPVRSNDSDAY